MHNYKKQLLQTATTICSPAKGILAADESPASVLKKFDPIDLENNPENRRKYREMLLTTPGTLYQSDLQKYISGVIFHQQTARQEVDGKTFVKMVAEKGIIPGIKVDKGTHPLHGGLDKETFTKGLDSLDAMAAEFYELGCRFAKWRAVIRISQNGPSDLSIKQNAWGLARYAAICQANGLVPIVEPQILADGEHSIEKCQQVSQAVFAQVFKYLNQNKVFLQGALLKPNMITYGLGSPDRPKGSFVQNAKRTCIALSRTVPPALTGIVFLSGGQSEEQASQNLNEMNKIKDIRHPWHLSFSFGRALQNSAIKAWHGKDENKEKGQQALIERAKANSLAQLGEYKGSKDESANESLYEKNYIY